MSVEVLAQRFLQAFLDHGVEVSQIPRFIPEIKLSDLLCPQSLLAALTYELLDKTGKLFGIRIQWLEGVDDRIYEYQACCKDMHVLLDHVAVPPVRDGIDLMSPVRVLTITKALDRHGDYAQTLVPVVLEKLTEQGDKIIYRYHVFQDGFDWRYDRTRIELKAIARILFEKLRTTIPLYVIDAKTMERVLEGALIPRAQLDGCLATSPSLEDFALAPEESAVSKEADELPVVLRYIAEHGLADFSFDPPSVQENEKNQFALGDSLVQPSSTGKRAQTTKVRWEPVEHVVKAKWDQENISITAMVKHIKNTPSLAASNLTESAIRKRIAKLAPEGIAGKPGRKPKKLS